MATKIEKIFNRKSSVDKKNKLNRSNEVINENVLQTIESGVTLEQIEDLASKVPVYKYQTQLTIHGKFPALENNGYVSRYKSLIVNKNKSLGVRWSAIDANKKMSIAKRLKFVGFNYNRNSTNDTYSITRRVDENNLSDVIKELKEISLKINLDLVFGSIALFKSFSLYGNYIILELNINAIREYNVESFLEPFRKDIESGELKEIQDNIEREKKRLVEQTLQNEKREQLLKEFKNDIDFVKSLEVVTKAQENSFYLGVSFNYNDNLKFNVRRVYKENKRSRLLSVNKNSFNTLQEAKDFINSDEAKEKTECIDYKIRGNFKKRLYK